jgi:hypothetical protein
MTTQLIHSDQLTSKIPHRQKRENCAQNEVLLPDHTLQVLVMTLNLQSCCALQQFQVTAPCIKKKGPVTLFAQTLSQTVTTGK